MANYKTYSINFFEDWENSTTYIAGSQLRETSIIGEVKISSLKLTSVDYFKSEARTAKLKFNNYTWFNEHILDFRSGILPRGTLGDTPLDYSRYKVKIFESDRLIFTGLVKLSTVKYDKKTDEVEMTCYDMLALFAEGLKLQLT